MHNARRLMEEKKICRAQCTTSYGGEKIAFNNMALDSVLSRLESNRTTEPFFKVEPYKNEEKKNGGLKDIHF